MPKDFIDSQEQAFRKFVREAIRKAPSEALTRGERDVVLVVANLWFHHKCGANGYIYPGRKKLAKRAHVSEKTVSRCLTRLRDAGALRAVSSMRGRGIKTAYVVRVGALLSLCGMAIPEMMPGEILEVLPGGKLALRKRDILHQENGTFRENKTGQNVPLLYRRRKAS